MGALLVAVLVLILLIQTVDPPRERQEKIEDRQRQKEYMQNLEKWLHHDVEAIGLELEQGVNYLESRQKKIDHHRALARKYGDAADAVKARGRH